MPETIVVEGVTYELRRAIICEQARNLQGHPYLPDVPGERLDPAHWTPGQRRAWSRAWPPVVIIYGCGTGQALAGGEIPGTQGQAQARGEILDTQEQAEPGGEILE